MAAVYVITMKTPVVFFTLLLAMQACSDHTVPCTPRADLWSQAVTLEIDFARTTCDPNTGFGIRFTKVISDSRCPSDVTCIWAGEGTVMMDVTQDDNVVGSVQLNTNRTPVNTMVNQKLYSLKLLELNPYPKLSERHEINYSVKVEVTPDN
jgi:hypothetical protein